MIAAPSQDWNIFKQIFVEHWNGFTRVYPRYHTRYYDGLVDKMLRCGNPDKIGYIEYRCLHCGQGKHLVAMSKREKLLSDTDRTEVPMASSLLVVEHVYVSETLNKPPHRPVGERSAAMIRFWAEYDRRYPGGKGAPGGKPRYDEAQSLALLYEHKAGQSIPALAAQYGDDRKRIWKAVCRGLYLRQRDADTEKQR